MWYARWPAPELYERSRRERKKIEMLFAHLKRIIGLRQLRLRGPTGAKDEFLLAATAQNTLMGFEGGFAYARSLMNGARNRAPKGACG
jgi:hypothetical protein